MPSANFCLTFSGTPTFHLQQLLLCATQSLFTCDTGSAGNSGSGSISHSGGSDGANNNGSSPLSVQVGFVRTATAFIDTIHPPSCSFTRLFILNVGNIVSICKHVFCNRNSRLFCFILVNYCFRYQDILNLFKYR